MRLQQFARKTVTPRRTRNTGAENLRLDMPVMPAHHLRRKPQPAGGWLISMGSLPSIAQMRRGLASPSIAQGFACLSMIAGTRLQSCFKGRCGTRSGRRHWPVLLFCATAAPQHYLPQPALGRLPHGRPRGRRCTRACAPSGATTFAASQSLQ